MTTQPDEIDEILSWGIRATNEWNHVKHGIDIYAGQEYADKIFKKHRTQAHQAITTMIQKERLDELKQGAEYKLLDGMVVHGRHDRSYQDRIEQLSKPIDGEKL